MTQPIWVLAVVAQPGEPASVSIHPTHLAAEAWLRSGWDPEGDFQGLDFDGLLERLRVDCAIVATVEPCVPDWL